MSIGFPGLVTLPALFDEINIPGRAFVPQDGKLDNNSQPNKRVPHVPCLLKRVSCADLQKYPQEVLVTVLMYVITYRAL